MGCSDFLKLVIEDEREKEVPRGLGARVVTLPDRSGWVRLQRFIVFRLQAQLQRTPMAIRGALLGIVRRPLVALASSIRSVNDSLR